MSDTKAIHVLSGGFDPLHVGHLRMIKAAHALQDHCRYGSQLIIGLNSDDWLRRKKGANFINFAHRAELIGGYKEVDEVVSFDDSDGTAKELLRILRARFPADEYNIIFCNGGDRVEGHVPEGELAEELDIEFLYGIGGGKIESSSELVTKYFAEINKNSA